MSKKNASAQKQVPEPPKRPQSGYFRFMAESREPLKKKNPTITNKELIKMLGDEWNKLPEGQKKKFNDAYEKEKKKYEEEIKAYESKFGPIKSKKEKAEKKETKETKEPKEPKGKKEKKSTKGK